MPRPVQGSGSGFSSLGTTLGPGTTALRWERSGTQSTVPRGLLVEPSLARGLAASLRGAERASERSGAMTARTPGQRNRCPRRRSTAHPRGRSIGRRGGRRLRPQTSVVPPRGGPATKPRPSQPGMPWTHQRPNRNRVGSSASLRRAVRSSSCGWLLGSAASPESGRAHGWVRAEWLAHRIRYRRSASVDPEESRSSPAKRERTATRFPAEPENRQSSYSSQTFPDPEPHEGEARLARPREASHLGSVPAARWNLGGSGGKNRTFCTGGGLL